SFGERPTVPRRRPDAAGVQARRRKLGGMPGSLPIGCTLPTSGAAADPAAIGALAQTAEDLGFDSVWISDHVVVPEHISSAYPYSPDVRFPTLPPQAYLEPLATLCSLAGNSRR